MEPLRLLILAPLPPRLDATHGGGRTMARLITALAERHDVGLMYLQGNDEPPLDSRLEAECATVVRVSRPGGSLAGRVSRRFRIAAGLTHGRPRWVTHTAVPAFAARAAELCRTWRPDVVQLEFHVMGQYLPALAGYDAPRVLVQHDPGAAAAWDARRGTSGWRRLAARLDALAWERHERRVLTAVDAVVVFTGRDRRLLEAQYPGVSVHEIPLLVPIPPAPLDPAGTERDAIVFVGNFGHPPNVDAAIRAARAILPRVRAQVSEARLYLVGDRPPSEVQALAGDGVVVTGRVPDVTPYLERAAVAVVPLRLGGGMRVKVAEALAAGKALVASPLALAGLDITDGEHALVAESDGEFARAIVALLTDAARRVELAVEARRWVEAHLGWERPIQAYDALYADLLEARRAGVAPP